MALRWAMRSAARDVGSGRAQSMWHIRIKSALAWYPDVPRPAPDFAFLPQRAISCLHV